MDLTTHQNNKLGQKPIMSKERQHSLKVLQLSRLELVQEIERELEENPALQTEDEQEDEFLKADTEEPENLPDSGDPLRDSIPEEEEHKSDSKPPIASKVSLLDYLTMQLRLTSLAPNEIEIGIIIAGSLNEDGYLKESVEGVAAICGCTNQLDKVHKVLSLMQSLPPEGLCARDLKECLLVQAKHRRLENSIVPGIIVHYLNELKKKDYKTIARELNVSTDEVAWSAKLISSFDPTPGRRFCRYYPDYVYPDLFLDRLEDKFEIRLNDDGMPKLKLSSLYRNNGYGMYHLSEEDKEYIRQKKQAVEQLAQSIYERQRTLCRVMESILKFQHDFFESGGQELKPLKMKTVAEDIGLSKSTVSRATMNKYVHTPMGVFCLRDFFKGAIEQGDGMVVSTSVLQEMIKKIISEENPVKPFSDAKIEKKLKNAGFDIQRRTIAKYREKMGILPASHRKKI
jgi:RNA polymerase sigma-54 factor